MAEIDTRAQIAILRTLITGGKSDSDIMKEMKLDLRTYNFLRKKLRQSMLNDLDERVAGEHWVEYALAQEAVIRQIDGLFETVKRDSPSALPALLRTKADIIDRIMDRAVSAGLIKLTPDRVDYDGMNLNDVPESELDDMIREELNAFTALKNGVESGNVIDFSKIRVNVAKDRKKARGG